MTVSSPHTRIRQFWIPSGRKARTGIIFCRNPSAAISGEKRQELRSVFNPSWNKKQEAPVSLETKTTAAWMLRAQRLHPNISSLEGEQRPPLKALLCSWLARVRLDGTANCDTPRGKQHVSNVTFHSSRKPWASEVLHESKKLPVCIYLFFKRSCNPFNRPLGDD